MDLFEAIERGDRGGVMGNIKKGVNLNGKDRRGYTPLIRAVHTEDIQITGHRKRVPYPVQESMI